MTVIHGFQLQAEQDIRELKVYARVFRHIKTGAELLSIISNDNNKVFGITFRTPPTDSTGIAHILEHSVLCGSRKYPVKEPFVELLKGSLHTFLNAFTYPDKTCYPIASQNTEDFYNLIDVYLDAVFYPRLTPFVFQQEGWHYELEDRADPLSFKGVVFNEMKGAYSSPDNVLSEQSLQSLFPDNQYGFDSGGDPKHIPDLTFEQFVAFHTNYYHPSNARIFFYGDDDPDERLKIIDKCISDFESINIDSAVALQPRFKGPKRTVRSFMVGEDTQSRAKGMVTLNWAFDEIADIQMHFALRILGYILLGMPASPLRKALIDSGLGEDIAGEGLGTELRQLYFSAGLKGVNMEHKDKVEALILDTLTSLVKEGIDPDTIAAALNTVEFRLRENNTGGLPQGLAFMLRSLTTWLYDDDPLALMAFETPMNAIKSLAKSKNTFFEEIIEQFFLENPHRTTLILEPDPDLRTRNDAAEKAVLEKARLSMNPSRVDGLIANTMELKRIQETPDTPEALATIPVLSLNSLAKKNKIIPLERFDMQGTPGLFHDLFTRGIIYMDLGLNLHTLPDKYLSYIPLFGRALVEMGTEKEDFVSLTQRISRETGGIRAQTFTSAVKNEKKGAAWLFLRGKAMQSKARELTRIMGDVLLGLRLDNRDRFMQIVLEEKARAEQALVSAGHQMVNLRIRAHFGEAHWASEQMHGISYIFFLRDLIQAVEKRWPEVLEILEEIRGTLVNKKAMFLNVTMEESNWSGLSSHVEDLLEVLPGDSVTETDWSTETSELFEGMTIPAHVNYVGKGAGLYEGGYNFHGAALVIAPYLRNSWLWDRIRVRGGAYGAFCIFDHLSGVLSFVSYRDPNLLKTLHEFDKSGRFLRDTPLNDRELSKSIIGAIGNLDAHMLPDAMGYTSMVRFLAGITDEDRQQTRDEILGTKPEDFMAFAQVLEQVKNNGIVKVLGSTSAIEAAVKERPGWLTIEKII